MNDEVQLASFFLLDPSINQIIPTTNNPRFCMNVPKRTSLNQLTKKPCLCNHLLPITNMYSTCT